MLGEKKCKAGLGQNEGPRRVGFEDLGKRQRTDLAGLKSPNVMLKTPGMMAGEEVGPI